MRRIVADLGSAHDDVEFVLLMQAARARLNEGKAELDLGPGAIVQIGLWRARVVATASQLAGMSSSTRTGSLALTS